MAALVSCLGVPAPAKEYDVPIEVEHVDDLAELRRAGELDDDAYAALVELLEHGVDLGRASRSELYALPGLGVAHVDAIIAYRRRAGGLRDPADLVVAGVLSAEQLACITPFLLVPDLQQGRTAPTGRARLQSAWSPVDGRAPTSALQLRATARPLSGGIAVVTTRKRIGPVDWTTRYREPPGTGTLAADGEALRWHLPKYFLGYQRRDWGVIAGTYRIGFGQRLTFDATDRAAPSGFYGDDAVALAAEMGRDCREASFAGGPAPCAGDVNRYRVSLNDFDWRDGLRGVALGVRGVGSHGRDGLDVHVWGSALANELYQYELYHTATCRDPRDAADEACGAPPVVRRPASPNAPATRFSFTTLPQAFVERLAGANVTYHLTRRAHVGMTGYLADTAFPARAPVDFAATARRPFGGAFGAAGVDLAWESPTLAAFLEASHSLDSASGGGGGPAALLRVVAPRPRSELEGSARIYSRGFDNPYARPIAAADEYEGSRARDEVGVRVKYAAALLDRRLSLRSQVDLWVQPTERQPKTFSYVRADLRVVEAVRPGLWLEVHSKDLTNFDRRACYEVGTEDAETHEPVPCQGESFKVNPRLLAEPTRRVRLALDYAHTWRDTERSDTSFARDQAVRASATVTPTPALRLGVRCRWADEDVGHARWGEEVVAASGEVTYRFPSKTTVALRYAVVKLLDARVSTGAVTPDPQHWGRVDLVQRF